MFSEDVKAVSEESAAGGTQRYLRVEQNTENPNQCNSLARVFW